MPWKKTATIHSISGSAGEGSSVKIYQENSVRSWSLAQPLHCAEPHFLHQLDGLDDQQGLFPNLIVTYSDSELSTFLKKVRFSGK